MAYIIIDICYMYKSTDYQYLLSYNFISDLIKSSHVGISVYLYDIESLDFLNFFVNKHLILHIFRCA